MIGPLGWPCIGVTNIKLWEGPVPNVPNTFYCKYGLCQAVSIGNILALDKVLKEQKIFSVVKLLIIGGIWHVDNICVDTHSMLSTRITYGPDWLSWTRICATHWAPSPSVSPPHCPLSCQGLLTGVHCHDCYHYGYQLVALSVMSDHQHNADWMAKCTWICHFTEEHKHIICMFSSSLSELKCRQN